MVEFLLPQVLFLHGRLRHLALQDQFPLFVHISLHPGKGVISHLTQIRIQVVLLRIVCKERQQ